MSTYIIIIIINLFFVDFEILQCQKNLIKVNIKVRK